MTFGQSHTTASAKFHQLHSASSERGPLLELHGFDGQISAPILYLSNNILHASRVV
jgi:hypothetical protein